MEKSEFTILIGSFARGTGTQISDLDILRVGHNRSIQRPSNIDECIPVSYVDYEMDTFLKLHGDGSLFLYHAFYEGILLEGNKTIWMKYKNCFSVAEDFTASIQEYLEVLSYIDNYPEYEKSVLPFLSNIYKCLKNIGVFRLASEKNYQFDKSLALEKGCGLDQETTKILVQANSVFERTTPVSPELMNEFECSARILKLSLKETIRNNYQ